MRTNRSKEWERELFNVDVEVSEVRKARLRSGDGVRVWRFPAQESLGAHVGKCTAGCTICVGRLGTNGNERYRCCRIGSLVHEDGEENCQ